MNLATLPLRDGRAVRCVVESPRGSTVKLKYEPQLECFTMSRPLIAGLSYPFDWGFLPSTRGDDGDPLDVMVLHEHATFPGLVLPCRLLAVLEAKSEGQRNDRFIAVPVEARHAVRWDTRLRAELEEFFAAAVALEGKRLKLAGWGGAAKARALLAKGEG